ncbi:hypothetical protein B0H11DRAFT_2432254, partial [Mycena galericulata]
SLPFPPSLSPCAPPFRLQVGRGCSTLQDTPPYIHYEGMQDLSKDLVLDNEIDIENRQITLAVHSFTQDTYNPATPLITYEMFKPFPSKTIKTIPLSSNCQGRQDTCVILPRRCTAFSGTSLLPPILSSTLTSIRPALEDRCKTASVGCRIPTILMRISATGVLLSLSPKSTGSYQALGELLLGSPTGGTCLPSYPDYWRYRALPGHVRSAWNSRPRCMRGWRRVPESDMRVISQTTHPTASAWLSPDALCGAKHCIRGQGFRFKLFVFVLILPRISARITTMDGAACCQRGAQANLRAGHSLITECTAATLHLNRSHARGRVPQEPSCLAAHATLGAQIRGYAACAAECGRIADRPRGARHGAWLWVTRDTERRMRQRGAHGSRSSPCTHCQQADAGAR